MFKYYLSFVLFLAIGASTYAACTKDDSSEVAKQVQDIIAMKSKIKSESDRREFDKIVEKLNNHVDFITQI